MVQNLKSQPLDLRKLKQEASAAPVPEDSEIAKILELTPREISLPIKYTAPDGQVYTGRLESHILSGDERLSAARMAANLLGNVNWENAPPIARTMSWSLAWLTHSLKNPPDWFLRWAQEDDLLMLTVYAEVQQHEARYFQGDTDESGQAAGIERVRVSSPFSTGTAAE